MQNILSNTLTKTFKSAWTSNVYLRLRIALCLVLCTLGLGLSVNAGGTNMTIIMFDAPGAGTAANQGTFPSGINPSGAITGFTRDVNSARHGFLRAPDGTFTIFDDPGAGTCSTSCGTIGPGQGTRAYAINPAGTITGFYSDNSARCHSYVRAANGTFTQIDAPDAGPGPFPQGTFPSEFTPAGINPVGAITGFYVDASSVQHGFVRAPGGAITEFDPTGSIFTNPNAIDELGGITGFYVDASGVGHGFLRAPNGTITSFDAPGAGTGGGQGTFGVSLIPNGEIEGVYVDANGVLHGFLLDQKGSFSVFDVPGMGTGAGQGTIPLDNNNPGTITGEYIDGGNVVHGFVVEGL
jgi:hypothetical protein